MCRDDEIGLRTESDRADSLAEGDLVTLREKQDDPPHEARHDENDGDLDTARSTTIVARSFSKIITGFP